MKEVQMWKELKPRIKESGRYRYTTVLGFVFLSLFFIPWHSRISSPAIMKAENEARVHSLTPGVIREVYVKEGENVTAGQAMFVLSSPSLEDEIVRTRQELEVTQLRSRRRASNIDDLSNMQVVIQQLQELESRLKGLYELRDQLTIRAPITGSLVDVQGNLHPGRWINPDLELAHIAKLDNFLISGLINSQTLGQVELAQTAVFIPDELELDTIDARVIEIEDANVQVLESPYLASTYGGDIPVREGDNKSLVPEKSVYRITMKPIDNDGIVPRVVRGKVHIHGEARSFAFRTYDLIATVLIRELGF